SRIDSCRTNSLLLVLVAVYRTRMSYVVSASLGLLRADAQHADRRRRQQPLGPLVRLPCDLPTRQVAVGRPTHGVFNVRVDLGDALLQVADHRLQRLTIREGG